MSMSKPTAETAAARNAGNSDGAKDALRLSEVRRVFRLIGEVRQMGEDPNVWRPHMVLRLRKMFEAQVVVSSEVHFRRTSDPNVMRLIDVGWGSDEADKTWQIHNERDDERPENYWLSIGKPEAKAPAAASSDVVPVVPAKKLYGGTTIVLSQYPLPHIGAVDQLGLHRGYGDPPFTAAQHKLVRLFHVELGRLWRKDVLSQVKDPTTDLPPRLQQTLAELMEGRSEKEIAGKLGLSKHTIHNYVKALHQRLGVSSRGELLALAGKAQKDKGFIPRLSVDAPKET